MDLIPSMKITEKHYYKDIPQNNISVSKPKIILEFESCLNLNKKYPNSVIHNFANNERPGGPTSVFNDDGLLIQQKLNSHTQEDIIIRHYKDNLLLPKKFYPIIDNSKLGTEALLYSKCNQMQPIITLPSINSPNFKNKKTKQSIINRILLMLYVCNLYEHYTLITGLWGCGAFGMKIEDLIDCWQDALKISKYYPKEIIFAIIIDDYTKKYSKDEIIKLFEGIIFH